MRKLRAAVVALAIIAGGLSTGVAEASVPRAPYYAFVFTWQGHDYCAWYHWTGSHYRPRLPYLLCDRRS